MKPADHALDSAPQTARTVAVMGALALVLAALPVSDVVELDALGFGVGAAGIVLAVVALLAGRLRTPALLFAVLIGTNLLISAGIFGLETYASDRFESELLYLAPLLLAALHHSTRSVHMSIVVAVTGFVAAVATPMVRDGAETSAAIDEIAPGAIVLGVALTATGLIVHGQAQRARAQRARLRGAVSIDPLTKVMSRSGLDEAIDAGAVPPGECAVVLVRVDQFARLTADEGQQVADDVLCAVANELVDGVRPTDLVARLRGEEFVIVLPHRRADQAVTVSQRLGTRLLSIAVAESMVSASYGITEWIDAEPFVDAMRRADLAASDAQEAGRDQAWIRLADESFRSMADVDQTTN